MSGECGKTGRPSAARRSKQILDAAETCFRLHGFHSTSMAELAAAANMSVGHIYRYFASKHDIISAIVQRDVAIAMEDFNLVEAEQGDIIPALLKSWRGKLEQMADPDRSALWLEILAEARRNPQASQLVHDARASIGRRLEDLITSGSAGRWTPREIAAKVSLLLVLTDAISLGAIGTSSKARVDLLDQVLSCAQRLLA